MLPTNFLLIFNWICAMATDVDVRFLIQFYHRSRSLIRGKKCKNFGEVERLHLFVLPFCVWVDDDAAGEKIVTTGVLARCRGRGRRCG